MSSITQFWVPEGPASLLVLPALPTLCGISVGGTRDDREAEKGGSRQVGWGLGHAGQTSHRLPDLKHSAE